MEALESNTTSAKPTLIVVPPTLIAQWQGAIRAICPEMRIKIWFGPKKQGSQAVEYLDGPLTRQSSIFHGPREVVLRTIVITSYLTLTSRNGPRSLTSWRVNQAITTLGLSRANARRHVAKSSYPPVPEFEWENNISQCFERVFLDEGHMVRNPDTATWEAVSWLRPRFYHIISATPLLNGLKDLVGLLGLLDPQDLWEDNNLMDDLEISDRIDTFDPWLESDDSPLEFLRYTLRSFKNHVLALEDLVAQGTRTRRLLTKCMLRRTYGSMIEGRRIGEILPAVQTSTITLLFTQTIIFSLWRAHSSAKSSRV